MFNKGRLLTLASLLSLTGSLMAQECYEMAECNRTYIGGFGGGLFSYSTRMHQMGTAFFADVDGGPLAVYAHGSTSSTSSGFGGVQFGHEWTLCPLNVGCSGWAVTPAVEAEAFWYSHTKKGHLINTTDRLPEHDFLDSFSMNVGVYLANVVFAFDNSCTRGFTPYIGGGIGATRISISDATSTQTSPEEPGINHFNSKRNDSSWTFAAQAKAGLRYNICSSLHIFGEYRYLFVDSSNYIFGSTDYPTHVPTSPWNVKVQNLQYNAFVLGIQYDL